MHPGLKLPVIFLLFICSLITIPLRSQTDDFISGKVINSETHEPVAFATVKLKHNQLGVYANAEGDFRILKNSGFQSDSVIITCIGFKRNSIAYKDLGDQYAKQDIAYTGYLWTC